LFILSFIIAVLANVVYHVFQKQISPAVNPVISMLVTYLAAMILSLPLLVIFPLKERLSEALQKLNWPSMALGMAIVGLELGFLLAYRAGWDLSLAGIATNAAAALLLLPIGILLFKEDPSLLNIVGVFVCILGLVLVNIQK
jgi:drug/metabolite transporter (DMT)-like permease